MESSLIHKPLAAILCGFERAGTTLLSEIFRQHPQLNSGFECGFLLVKKPSDFLLLEPYCTNFKIGWKIGDNALKYICEADTWLEVYKRIVERSPIIKRKDEWIFDKTPKYMEVLSDVLLKVPNVPCVVLVRDPRSVLWSWAKRTNLSIEQWTKKHLEKSCVRYMSYAEGYKNAIENGFSSRILLVKYEDICTNKIVEVKKIFDFIGMDFDSSYLHFKENIRFPNVHEQNVSTKYLQEYKDNFPEEICQKILELTKEVEAWSWET